MPLQQAAARNELEAADRGKNEFLAVLSHELRNPLAAVRTAVHLLEHVPPGGDLHVAKPASPEKLRDALR